MRHTPNDEHIGKPTTDDLETALKEGDPQQVRALIEAGADIRYKRRHGYDALLAAVHGRDIARDPRLLELLSLLVENGVDLSGISAYKECGLRILSWIGRFDAVRLLLDAGADKSLLRWTPLMEAVATGSLSDVRAMLDHGVDLEERDYWSRTAWLIALQTGDMPRVTLLRERGANPAALGRCGSPPLFFAIRSQNSDIVGWLLDEGADANQTDELGATALTEAAKSANPKSLEIILAAADIAGLDQTNNLSRTALMEAVESDSLECVEILLVAGADVEVGSYGTPLRWAKSREIIMRLLEAGADPADANQRIILGLDKAREEVEAVSLDEFRSGFRRRFGQKNPEKMVVPFWEVMIRSGASGWAPRSRFEAELGPIPEPVWCAQRFGQSLTLLPDGRAIQIAGEHEDSYDPDFCIYNDVFVHGPDGSVAIYGYPESLFPPTDFHTATLIGDSIYVIGSLGYQGTRRYGVTPVYRLDINSLAMERLDPSGEAPGWIYRHRAVAVDADQVRVWGGKLVTGTPGAESHDENPGSFVLDLDSLIWRRE